ncbi:MAG: hypothetical protein ORN21_01615 [Methylophilaceae bacterium]|nr:hypothetical protein [Methylophilaceae bacterium]
MSIKNNIKYIPHLFDRGMPSKHPWQLGMVSLQDSVLVEERAVHGNLAMDHRVGATHEEWLVQTQPTVSIDDLRAYFTAQCCVPAPKFLGKPLRSLGATDLLHVTSLLRLLSRLGTQQLLELNDFLDEKEWDNGLKVDTKDDLANKAPQIAQKLNELSEDAFREAIGFIHNLSSKTLPPTGASPPWWASPVREVEQQTELQNGPALLRLLGIKQFYEQDWLLVYRYRASDVGLLYQPTTLESNAYLFHFPSPPDVDAGLTMPLDSKSKPCLEYLHQPLNTALSAQKVLRPLLPLHTPKDGQSQTTIYAQQLGEYRQNHRQKLCLRSQVAGDWLSRHPHLF